MAFGLPTFGMEVDRYGDPENLNMWWTMINEIPTGFIGLVGLAWLGSSIVSLEKNEAAVLVGFFDGPKGVFNKSGANFKLPYPFTKVRSRVSLKTDMESTTLKDIKTKNVPVPEIPVHIEYRVVDAEKFVYNSDKPKQIMVEQVSRAVKSKIKAMTIDEIIADLTEMSDKVKEEINKEMLENFGIEISDVIVDEPQLPKAYEDAFIRKEAATQIKGAAELEGSAEGERIVQTMKAIALGMKDMASNSELQKIFKDSGMSTEDFLRIAQGHVVAIDATKNGGIVVAQGGVNNDTSSLARGIAIGEKRAAEQSAPKVPAA